MLKDLDGQDIPKYMNVSKLQHYYGPLTFKNVISLT